MRRILAVLVLSCLWPSSPAPAQTPGTARPGPIDEGAQIYVRCAALHGFPKTGPGHWAQPRELTLAQKRTLMKCVQRIPVPAFIDWVNRELAEDIGRGTLRAAVEPLPLAPPPTALQVAQRGFLHLVVLMGIILGIGMALAAHAKSRGTTVGKGPKALAFVGLGLLLVARFDPTKRDEMDALFPVMLAMLGLILLALAGIWAFIGIRMNSQS